jgi:hypothetical protein
MLPYLMHPFVVSPKKLTSTGWAPRFGSREALRAVLGEA